MSKNENWKFYTWILFKLISEVLLFATFVCFPAFARVNFCCFIIGDLSLLLPEPVTYSRKNTSFQNNEIQASLIKWSQERFPYLVFCLKVINGRNPYSLHCLRTSQGLPIISKLMLLHKPYRNYSFVERKFHLRGPENFQTYGHVVLNVNAYRTFLKVGLS